MEKQFAFTKAIRPKGRAGNKRGRVKALIAGMKLGAGQGIKSLQTQNEYAPAFRAVAGRFPDCSSSDTLTMNMDEI